MRRKALLVALITAAAFALLFTLFTLLPKPKESQLYYPIRVGDKREYLVGADVISTHEVKSVEERDGDWFVSELISTSASEQTRSVSHRVSDTGLRSVGSIDSGTEFRAYPLLKLAPGGNPLPDGTTWEVDDAGATPGNYLKLIYTASAEEIEVPAGKYKAVKVEMRTRCEVNGKVLPETSRATTWYAKRVGVVKGVRTSPDGKEIGRIELKSFTPGKG
ncbi:MAG TPA: hypothetical protein VD866_33110 [Urbifossiella sp.]|nr:hypothetical protein [Urbifossiella sp.]